MLPYQISAAIVQQCKIFSFCPSTLPFPITDTLILTHLRHSESYNNSNHTDHILRRAYLNGLMMWTIQRASCQFSVVLQQARVEINAPINSYNETCRGSNARRRSRWAMRCLSILTKLCDWEHSETISHSITAHLRSCAFDTPDKLPVISVMVALLSHTIHFLGPIVRCYFKANSPEL